MSGLLLGNDAGFGMPDPNRVQLEQLVSLQGIVRQLDLLIQLECGLIKRADLKAELLSRQPKPQESEVPSGA